MSGRIPSYSQARSLPVRQRPYLSSSVKFHLKGSTHCLDFITNKQDSMLLAKFMYTGKVTRFWNDDSDRYPDVINSNQISGKDKNVPCFSLDWLNQKSSNMFSMELQGPFKVFNNTKSDGLRNPVVLIYRADPLKVWTKASPAVGICAHTRSGIIIIRQPIIQEIRSAKNFKDPCGIHRKIDTHTHT